MLHPGAWWLWALGLAAVASRTSNPVPLLLVVAVTWFVYSARRSSAPWARSYALFFRLALFVIALHVVFQALFSNQTQGLTVLVHLPEVHLPASIGVRLGGDITLEAVLNALYSGLQLATIFCCFGAANALGSARRLIRYLPGALYEIGIAVTIALTFAPQLAADAGRVREASRLRGGSGRGRLRRVGRLAMPVVEGALERTVDLAAAMDSRGYGRTVEARAGRRRTVALVLFGAFGLTVGLYGMLSAQRYGVPMLVVGAGAAILGLRVGGRRTSRSRYKPDPWAVPELLVAGCGLLAGVVTWWTAAVAPAQLTLPGPLAVPPVPVAVCIALLVAAAPAFLAPPVPEDLR